MSTNPRHLLVIGFSAVMFLMGLVVVIAMTSLSTIGARYERSADHDLQIVFALEELEKAGFMLLSSSAEIVIVSAFGLGEEGDELDADDRERAEKGEAEEIDEAIEMLNVATARLLELNRQSTDDQSSFFEPRMIDKLTRLVEGLTTASQQQVAIALAGESAGEIFAAKEALEDVEEAFLATVQEMLAVSQERFVHGSRAVRNLIDLRGLFIIASFIAALIVAIASAILASRKIIRILRDLGLTQSARAEAETQALTDDLTGLPNRTAFYKQIEAHIAAANGEPLQLLLIDLDGFKQVNDLHGHLTGDELLRSAAARMVAVIDQRGTLTRLGGDEFALLLPATPDHIAARLAGAIISEVSRAYRLGGTDIEIGASIGHSSYPDRAPDVIELIHTADLALYDAKAAGKGCVRQYDKRASAARSTNSAYRKQDLRVPV